MELKGVIVYLLLAEAIFFLSATESVDVLKLPTESVKPPNEVCCNNVWFCALIYPPRCTCKDLYSECPSWCYNCQQEFTVPSESPVYRCTDLREEFNNNACS